MPHHCSAGARCHGLLLAVCLALLPALGGCSTDEEPYVERPVDELYNTALSDLGQKDYKKAAKQFDEVERQHPYSPWATKAQLMSAYAYYEGNEYDDAVLALERFIDINPAHPDVAYAYYLRAMCFYERISQTNRDQQMTEKAKLAFEEVLSRFPDSPYARDSRLKLDLILDHLAGHEMVVGRYYLNRGFYLAAVNRFRTVVEKYQTTSQVPEALLRLTEAYTALGLHDQARLMTQLLAHNYPASDWYADAYALAGGPGGTPTAPQRGWWPF